MMKRGLKRGATALVGLITLAALAWAIENYRGAKTWEQTKREFEQKGESFDFTTLIPPPIPDDQNFAATPLLAALFDYTRTANKAHGPYAGSPFQDDVTYHQKDRVERLQAIKFRKGDGKAPSGGGWQTKQKAMDLTAWADYYRENPGFSHAPANASASETVLIALSQYDKELNELKQAARHRQARFPLHYDENPWATMLIQHLTPALGLSQVLALQASAELAAGHNDRALQDLGVIWKFREGLAKEPLLISQLVSLSITNISLQPVWEGLLQRRWSQAELQTIQESVSGMKFLQEHGLAIRGESLGFAVQILEWIKTAGMRGRRHFFSILTDLNKGLKRTPELLINLFPNGWIDQNKASIVRFYLADYLPSIDAPGHRIRIGAIQAAEMKVNELSPYNPYNMHIRLTVPAILGSIIKSAQAQTWADEVVTACALERYRLEHGAYPSQLTALVPEFLPAEPVDVIDGQPLRYAQDPANNRYKLYSIGWNQRDDGGTIVMRKDNPERIDEKQGDWVWAYSESAH